MTEVRRVVLVGFMGAGKSTVARLVARRLGWAAVDLDREIERAAGTAIPEIFRWSGEAHFRDLEREATMRLADRTGIVLASGGGWMAQPGLRELLGPGTLTVWLRASPAAVLRRIGPGGRGRPLLAGSTDPQARIEELLAARDPLYGRADVAVETDGLTPDQVANEVERAVRSRASQIRSN